MRLLIIGGDERSLMLKALALARGHDAALIGHGENDLPPRGLYGAAALPFPFAEREGRVPAPLGCGSLSAEEALSCCSEGALIFAANAGPALEEAIHRRGCTRIDPMQDEAFVRENAAVTAECAVGAAMARSPRCLMGAQCLVAGYGRIGRALALRLYGLRARVSVAARRQETLAEAAGDGMDAVPLCGPFPKQYQFFFNTIPAPGACDAALCALAPGALAIDLAGAPFGFSPEDTAGHGVRAFRESGLPGRCAPESAAQAILSLAERAALAQETGHCNGSVSS